jgi:hypothetical protein
MYLVRTKLGKQQETCQDSCTQVFKYSVVEKRKYCFRNPYNEIKYLLGKSGCISQDMSIQAKSGDI